MDFLPEELQKYIEAHTVIEPELLSDLNRETNANILMPRMLSGHLQGRILAMFSKMIKPSNILEIGTYTGYSAICLCEGLQKEGKLLTLDINEELEDVVRKHIERNGLSEVIDYQIGNAMEIIPELSGPFDLVFIDADKVNYSNYFDLVIDKLNTGGYILADNVLWSGKVLDTDTDADTQAIKDFNDKVQQDDRVENVLFPVRDGIMVLRKR